MTILNPNILGRLIDTKESLLILTIFNINCIEINTICCLFSPTAYALLCKILNFKKFPFVISPEKICDSENQERNVLPWEHTVEYYKGALKYIKVITKHITFALKGQFKINKQYCESKVTDTELCYFAWERFSTLVAPLTPTRVTPKKTPSKCGSRFRNLHLFSFNECVLNSDGRYIKKYWFVCYCFFFNLDM